MMLSAVAADLLSLDLMLFAPNLHTEDAQTCYVWPAYSTYSTFTYLMSIQVSEKWEEISLIETNIIIEHIY